MPKIIHAQSGPQPPDPDTRPAVSPPDKVEMTITPEPKTRTPRQANAKARRLAEALKRQQANSYAPRKRIESQRTAQRKRKRDLYYHKVQADLAAGKITEITEEQAKERLTKRHGPDTADVQLV
jgi:hypothetical protein